MSRPFVVTIASEKGGVGKTTIATNLAVYIKALREDLPVAIASFDNHFSVDQMFSLGAHSQAAVADIFGHGPIDELFCQGQYGIMFIPSSRQLAAPPHPPEWLCKRLCSLKFGGILILDTRPMLDWFTRAALTAADLVIAPIKDRPSLTNAQSIKAVLSVNNHDNRLWLLPSLVDVRSRLSPTVRVHEFLSYSAEERDYQVLDLYISKSPKVESLASGFSSHVRPILTQAKNTAVHAQFKQLAEFVLSKYEAPEHTGHKGSDLEVATLIAEDSLESVSPGSECSICGKGPVNPNDDFFLDIRSRRQGHIHRCCITQILYHAPEICAEGKAVIAVVLDGPGKMSAECRLNIYSFDMSGVLSDQCVVEGEMTDSWKPFLETVLRLPVEKMYRELILISLSQQSSEQAPLYNQVHFLNENRRKILAELRDAGLI